MPSTYEPNCPTATIVKIGWVKAEKQFDGLFRGGPDLQFARAEGTASPGSTTATVNFPQEVGCSLTRGDVRKKTWKEINAIWDLDWNISKTEEAMVVYDWDRKGTKKWSGSVKIKAGPVELNAGFEKEITSQNELIKNMQMPRAAFFAANVVDLGNGTRDGFAVYRSDEVFFTIPIQIVQ